MITPGASSAAASTLLASRAGASSARRDAIGGERRARGAPVPATTGSFKARRSGVDLAQLARGPLHRLLGLHLAAARLRVHHGDDVLVPGLGGLLVRLALASPSAASAARRGAGTAASPGRSSTSRASPSRASAPIGEALLHGEPLLVVLLGVRPAQELDRALRVLRVLHHHVVERGVVGVRALRGPPAAARAGCRCAAARPSRS